MMCLRKSGICVIMVCVFEIVSIYVAWMWLCLCGTCVQGWYMCGCACKTVGGYIISVEDIHMWCGVCVECVSKCMVIERVYMWNCVSMHTLSSLSIFWTNKKYFRNVRRHRSILKICVSSRLCIFVFPHKAIIPDHSQRQPSWTFGKYAQNNIS